MLPNELLKRQWKHTEKTPTPDFEDERATSFLFVYSLYTYVQNPVL